ncbi:hypothetical protein [Gimesia panareensis]|uniref:hypothetical protein n=1 Tax=Gimesia panareensis TaxID=2527978 RepID=UPI00118C96DB|nr:hypothetical protein [Gimesia panareensis]QDU51212.1 hypothetical protein Pan110_35760 [Gimesia panareensis]
MLLCSNIIKSVLRKKEFAAALILSFSMLYCTNPVSGDEKLAVYTAEEIQKKIANAQSRLKSYAVTYVNDEYDSSFPSGTYLRRKIAAKAPCQFLHVSLHGHAELDWTDDPYQQNTYVTDTEVYNFNPVNQAFFYFKISPEDPLPGSLKWEFFCLATGLWPLERPAPRRNQKPWMLKEIATSEHYAVVRRNQELINGRWCHVLEWPDEDTLWLDVERSCALLARETWDPQHLNTREYFELSEHHRFPGEIWLPMKIRRIRTQVDQSSQKSTATILSDSHIRVVHAQVNDVPDNMFLYQPGPGALRLSTSGGRAIQVLSGGYEHLDQIVQWSRRCGYALPHKTSFWRDISLVCAAFLIVFTFESYRIKQIQQHSFERKQDTTNQ